MLPTRRSTKGRRLQTEPARRLSILFTSLLVSLSTSCDSRSIPADGSEGPPRAPQSCAGAKAWINTNKSRLGGLYLLGSHSESFNLVVDKSTVITGPGDPRTQQKSSSEIWGLYFSNLRVVYNSARPPNYGAHSGLPLKWIQIGEPPGAPSSPRKYLGALLNLCTNQEAPIFRLRILPADTLKWYVHQIESSTYCDFNEKTCDDIPKRARV